MDEFVYLFNKRNQFVIYVFWKPEPIYLKQLPWHWQWNLSLKRYFSCCIFSSILQLINNRNVKIEQQVYRNKFSGFANILICVLNRNYNLNLIYWKCIGKFNTSYGIYVYNGRIFCKYLLLKYYTNSIVILVVWFFFYLFSGIFRYFSNIDLTYLMILLRNELIFNLLVNRG